MRVDAASYTNLIRSMADLSDQQTGIAEKISSGLKISALSDDPTVAGQAVSLANTVAQQDSFLATANTVSNRMQAADTALSSVVTQLTSAVATAVGAMNDTTSDSGRATAVQQLQAARSSLLSLANSSFGGAYLFGGTATAQPFTQASDGSITYSGNNNASSISLLSGGDIQSSLPGSDIFMASGASVFGSLNDLINALGSGPVDAATSSTLVSNLRSSLANVSAQRAVLNASQGRLSGESDFINAQETNLKAQQGTLLSADTADLATQLSAVTTQRSALLSTISIIEKGSLFDYLQ